MPIIDIENSRQLEFGYGDISVGHGLLKSDDIVGVVLFAQQEKQYPIGAEGIFKNNQEVDISETPVRMTFEKIESIDVIIEELQKAKAMMLAKMQEQAK